MDSIGHTLAQIIWHADSHCIKLFCHLYIFFYIPFCILCMQFVNFISFLLFLACKVNAQCYHTHCRKCITTRFMYFFSFFKPFWSYTFFLYLFLAHFAFDLLIFLSRVFLAKRKQNASAPIADSVLLFSLCYIFIQILHAHTSFLPRTYLTYFACTLPTFSSFFCSSHLSCKANAQWGLLW